MPPHRHSRERAPRENRPDNPLLRRPALGPGRRLRRADPTGRSGAGGGARHRHGRAPAGARPDPHRGGGPAVRHQRALGAGTVQRRAAGRGGSQRRRRRGRAAAPGPERGRPEPAGHLPGRGGTAHGPGLRGHPGRRQQFLHPRGHGRLRPAGSPPDHLLLHRQPAHRRGQQMDLPLHRVRQLAHVGTGPLHGGAAGRGTRRHPLRRRRVRARPAERPGGKPGPPEEDLRLRRPLHPRLPGFHAPAAGGPPEGGRGPGALRRHGRQRAHRRPGPGDRLRFQAVLPRRQRAVPGRRRGHGKPGGHRHLLLFPGAEGLQGLHRALPPPLRPRGQPLRRPRLRRRPDPHRRPPQGRSPLRREPAGSPARHQPLPGPHRRLQLQAQRRRHQDHRHRGHPRREDRARVGSGLEQPPALPPADPHPAAPGRLRAHLLEFQPCPPRRPQEGGPAPGNGLRPHPDQPLHRRQPHSGKGDVFRPGGRFPVHPQEPGTGGQRRLHRPLRRAAQREDLHPVPDPQRAPGRPLPARAHRPAALRQRRRRLRLLHPHGGGDRRQHEEKGRAPAEHRGGGAPTGGAHPRRADQRAERPERAVAVRRVRDPGNPHRERGPAPGHHRLPERHPGEVPRRQLHPHRLGPSGRAQGGLLEAAHRQEPLPQDQLPHPGRRAAADPGAAGRRRPLRGGRSGADLAPDRGAALLHPGRLHEHGGPPQRHRVEPALRR